MKLIVASLCASLTLCLNSAERDPLQQPFHQRSIWNHPIGDAAKYVPAGLKRSVQFGVFAEEEIIILAPQAPLTDVFENHADWHKAATAVLLMAHLT